MEMGLFCKVQRSPPGHFKKNIFSPPPLFIIVFLHSLKSISRLFFDSQMKVKHCFLKTKWFGHCAIPQNSVWKEFLKEFGGGDGTVKCQHSLLNLH